MIDSPFRLREVSEFKSGLYNVLLPWTNLRLHNGTCVSHSAYLDADCATSDFRDLMLTVLWSCTDITQCTRPNMALLLFRPVSHSRTCKLIINTSGRPLLEALNREREPFQNQTIWPSIPVLVGDNTIKNIYFWNIKSKVKYQAFARKWMTAVRWRLHVQKSLFKRFIVFLTLSKLHHRSSKLSLPNKWQITSHNPFMAEMFFSWLQNLGNWTQMPSIN